MLLNLTIATIDHKTRIYQMIKKKGYIRVTTSFGDLNFEVHCDVVPITCHNFILLCNQGYYDNTGQLISVSCCTVIVLLIILQCSTDQSGTSWYGLSIFLTLPNSFLSDPRW